MGSRYFYTRSDGQRLRGVYTDYTPEKPKKGLMKLDDETTIHKLNVIGTIIDRSLKSGKEMIEITDKLISNALYSEFIKEYQKAYNSRNNTKFNRYEIMNIIYQNNMLKTKREDKEDEEL